LRWCRSEAALLEALEFGSKLGRGRLNGVSRCVPREVVLICGHSGQR
jgi:hypothetical protein